MELTISQRILWTAAALIAVALLFVTLKPILMPFIVAALFAYLMDPLTDKLETWKLNRTAAVSLVFLLIALLTLLMMLLIVPMMIEQVGRFIQRIPQVLAWLQASLLPYIKDITGSDVQGLPLADLQQLLGSHWQQAGSLAGSFLKTATASTMSVVALAANVTLIPVVGFYLLRDWDKLMLAIQQLLPLRIRTKTTTLASECNEVLSAFIHGQLLVMLSLGIVYAIGLAIVGVDLALFLGALAGLASVVPYLGVIVGITAASVAAYMQFQEWMPLVWVALVFGIGQILESVLLTPLLVGDKIGLHPVAVIFAIMAGGQIAGFVGILIALPVAAVLMVFVRHLHNHYQSSHLYLNTDE